MNLKTMVVAALLLVISGCLTGCSLFDAHTKEFDLMRGLATDAALRLKDGAISQMQVSGQGLNPGIVAEAAVVYRASCHYEGLAGQFGVASQGVSGRSIDPVDTLAIINSSTTADEARTKFVNLLLEKATAPKPQVVPTPPTP